MNFLKRTSHLKHFEHKPDRDQNHNCWCFSIYSNFVDSTFPAIRKIIDSRADVWLPSEMLAFFDYMIVSIDLVRSSFDVTWMDKQIIFLDFFAHHLTYSGHVDIELSIVTKV